MLPQFSLTSLLVSKKTLLCIVQSLIILVPISILVPIASIRSAMDQVTPHPIFLNYFCGHHSPWKSLILIKKSNQSPLL